jgi:hypothetical protein
MAGKMPAPLFRLPLLAPKAGQKRQEQHQRKNSVREKAHASGG